MAKMFMRTIPLKCRSSVRERSRSALVVRFASVKAKPNAQRRPIALKGRDVPTLPWPVNFLEDAHKTGLIALSSLKATDFLTDFAQIAKGGPPAVSVAQPLIQKYDIAPRMLFWLGWILQKAVTDDPKLGSVAKLLQSTAAMFQDEYASLILVESALRANKPHASEIRDAVNTLNELSNQGHLYAKERLAALHEQMGNKQKALALAEDALATGAAPTTHQSFVLDPRFSAWKTTARLRGATENAKPTRLDAIEHGAKILDDPDAYYDLASMSRDLPPQQRIAYLLKAAASGDARAALAVGDKYLELSKMTAPKAAAEEAPKDRTAPKGPSTGTMSSKFNLALASEWYELALKSPKHGLELNKEEAGDRLLVALQLLDDSTRCAVLASQYPEMRWAKKLLSNTAQKAQG